MDRPSDNVGRGIKGPNLSFLTVNWGVSDLSRFEMLALRTRKLGACAVCYSFGAFMEKSIKDISSVLPGQHMETKLRRWERSDQACQRSSKHR